MIRFCTALLTSAVAAFSLSAAAQENYPNKPIRVVIGYSAGGGNDIIVRVMTPELSKGLGQPVIVDNKPGAQSIIAAEHVAKQPADGYTILMGPSGPMTINPATYSKLPYDPVRDFTPISMICSFPLLLVVDPKLPVKNVKELIAYAKANPGKVSFGSSGVGSATHLTIELLKQTAGIQMEHIPFKGTAPGMAAAIAGDIQVLGDVPSSLMPQVRAGRLRALALFAAKRSPGAPEVPTIVEAGGPPVEGSTWVMFVAPAGTPAAIVNRISSETAKIVADPAMRERFEQIGIEGVGMTPAQTGRFLSDEIAKWAKVIQVAGVKAEQ